ncbi:uncharacterized protein [Brachyistius frenatus]|uniref:uncharacterized protein isoform X1 n=2 Tax=Brachyistius frenatus TaxID=100188 RepID=UPI0037E90103
MHRGPGYSRLRDMSPDEPAEWRKFFVVLSGKTNGAHLWLVERLKRFGHTEVDSPESCDYVLVFCPVASRVGTDVGGAMDKIPSGKQAVLVVMHYTFNTEYVLADSRRQVNNPDVCLTLDCLFFENKLLNCDRNDTMWSVLQMFLGPPISRDSILARFSNCCRNNRRFIVSFTIVVFGLTMAVLVWKFLKK